MEEPLLGVRIPEQLGRQTDGYWAPGLGAVQLAVVLQAFDDPLAQDCLGKICGLYVGAGVRLIGVEAADGPIRPRPGNTDIRHLIATETVSAGVLSLVNAGEVAVDVWGVDDVSLIPPSHQAMAVVSGARERREEFFRDVIRPLLETAQHSRYPGELVQLRRGRLSVYGARKTMVEQARLARAAAGRLGLDMDSFPLVSRFLEMAEQERSQRPGVIRAQQEEFLKRVMGRVHGWYRPAGPNRLDIDLGKAAPVLQYWVEETGQSIDEFKAAFARQNIEPVLLACKEWYDSWITSQARSGASHQLFEQLMRLALRLEVPYFDLRQFREYVAQQRDTEALRLGLDDELGDLTSSLIDAAGARSLGDIEEKLDLIYRMLQLAVGPKDAEANVGEVTTVKAALVELFGVVDGPSRAEPPERPETEAPVEEALAAARNFLALSRDRSKHMVKRILTLIAQRNEDRAVLAIGGFHARAVGRAMDDYPQVSWAIIMPQVDVDAAWREHHRRF